MKFATIQPFLHRKAITANTRNPLCDLGWKSLGVPELTAMTSIQRGSWVPTLHETHALLVWGGDVLYLRHWMQASGLAELLPSLSETTYVGVSAGSIVLTPYNCDAEFDLQFVPEGSDMGEDAGAGLGLVDFALRVHLDREGFDDSTLAEVEKWAAGIPAPTYAIDDETAIEVTDGTVEVVSAVVASGDGGRAPESADELSAHDCPRTGRVRAFSSRSLCRCRS